MIKRIMNTCLVAMAMVFIPYHVGKTSIGSGHYIFEFTDSNHIPLAGIWFMGFCTIIVSLCVAIVCLNIIIRTCDYIMDDN